MSYGIISGFSGEMLDAIKELLFDVGDVEVVKLQKIRDFRNALSDIENEVIAELKEFDELDKFVLMTIRGAGEEGANVTVLRAAVKQQGRYGMPAVDKRLEKLREAGAIRLMHVLPPPGQRGRSSKRYFLV